MRLIVKPVATLALLALAAGVALAAAPPKPGQDPFAKFGDEHKYTFELLRMARQIQGLDMDAKHALAPGQAKKVLAILLPLRSKPKLTQTQAKSAVNSLKMVFTADQLKAMAKLKSETRVAVHHGGPGGPPPGLKGKPGMHVGPPPNARSGGTHMTPAAMKDWNPFYVNKSNPNAAGMSKHWDDFFGKLQARAKGKPVKSPVKASNARGKGKK